MKICLGFDTSNYTTSIAAYGDNMLINERRLLDVKRGERGLRQSDALFQHIRNLPELYHEFCSEIDMSQIEAVGVSTRPRSVEGSYMPVFLAGRAYAYAVADTLGKPMYEFSHQDGHIMAGILSSGISLTGDKFISVHLSGGTTEILKTSYNGYGFDCEIIGGTKDISAGQVIDRIGVAAGLDFPCGKVLDEISSKNPVKLPVCVSGGYFNFSGLEAQGMQALSLKKTEDVAAGVFYAVSQTLTKALNNCVGMTGIKTVLIAGGVASNTVIREQVKKNVLADVFFASGELSCDNAVGIAACAEKAR